MFANFVMATIQRSLPKIAFMSAGNAGRFDQKIYILKLILKLWKNRDLLKLIGINMWQISAGLGVALAITGGAFKLYFDKAEAEKEALAVQLRQAADNQVVLENSIAGLNEQVLQAEDARKKAFEQISTLQAANDAARQEVSDLREKFNKHDMNILSLRKPGLIEKIINNGTREVLDEFENLTVSNADND